MNYHVHMKPWHKFYDVSCVFNDHVYIKPWHKFYEKNTYAQPQQHNCLPNKPRGQLWQFGLRHITYALVICMHTHSYANTEQLIQCIHLPALPELSPRSQSFLCWTEKNNGQKNEKKPK